MKTVNDLKVGDICYWFSEHGEFEREVKVESIKSDNDTYLGERWRVRVENQGMISVEKNLSYGDSIDFPGMKAFFSKEAAINYFLDKIEKSVSILRSSIIKLNEN